MELEIGLRAAPIEFKPAKRDSLRRRGTAHFCVGHNAYAVTDGCTFALLGVDGREPRLSRSVMRWRDNLLRFRMSSLGTFAVGIDSLGLMASWHVQIDSYVVRTIPLSLLRRLNPSLESKSHMKKTLEGCCWVWISDDGCCLLACFASGKMIAWSGTHWDAKGQWSFIQIPLLLPHNRCSNLLFPVIETDTVDNDRSGRGLVFAQACLDIDKEAIHASIYTILSKASCTDPQHVAWRLPLPRSAATSLRGMKAWLHGSRRRSKVRSLRQRVVMAFDGTRTVLAIGAAAACRSKKSSSLHSVCFLHVVCTSAGTHWEMDLGALVQASNADPFPSVEGCMARSKPSTIPQYTVESLQWVASDLLLVVLLNSGHLLIFSKSGIPLRIRPSPALSSLSSSITQAQPTFVDARTTQRLAATPSLAPWQQRDTFTELYSNHDIASQGGKQVYPWALPLFCDLVPPGAQSKHMEQCCSLALHATQADLLVRVGNHLVNLRLPAVLAAPRQICRPTPHLFYLLTGHPTLPSGQSRAYILKTMREGTFADNMKPWLGLKKLISAGWKVARNFRIMGADPSRSDSVASPTMRPRQPADGRYGLRGSIEDSLEPMSRGATTPSLPRRRSSSFIDEEGNVSAGSSGPVDVSSLPEGAAGVAGVHRVLPTSALPDVASVPARLFSPPIGSTALAQAPLCLVPQPLHADGLLFNDQLAVLDEAYGTRQSEDPNPQPWAWSLGVQDAAPSIAVPWTADMGIKVDVSSGQASDHDLSPRGTMTSSLKSPLFMLSPSSRSNPHHGRDVVVSTPFAKELKSPSPVRAVSPRLGGTLSIATRLDLWASYLQHVSPPPSQGSASDADEDSAASDVAGGTSAYQLLQRRPRRRRSSAPGRPVDPSDSRPSAQSFSFQIEDIVVSEVRSTSSDPPVHPLSTHKRDRSSSLELVTGQDKRRNTTHRSQLSYLLPNSEPGRSVAESKHEEPDETGPDVYRPVMRAQKSLRSPWEPETPLLSRLSAVASPSASRGRFGWTGAQSQGRPMESASARRAALAEAAALSSVLEGGQWLGEGKQGASWGNTVTSDASVLARGSSVRGGSVLGSWDSGILQVWPNTWDAPDSVFTFVDSSASDHITVGLEAANQAISLSKLEDSAATPVDRSHVGNPLPLANSEVMCNMLPTSRGSLSPALMLALTAIACISVGRPFLATAGLRLLDDEAEDEREERKYESQTGLGGIVMQGAPRAALTAWSLVQGQGHGCCGVACIPWQTLLVQTGIRAVVSDTLKMLCGATSFPVLPLPWESYQFSQGLAQVLDGALSTKTRHVLRTVGAGFEVLRRSGGGSIGAATALLHTAIVRLGVEGDVASAEALVRAAASLPAITPHPLWGAEWLRLAALYWTCGQMVCSTMEAKYKAVGNALLTRGQDIFRRLQREYSSMVAATLEYGRLLRLFGTVPRPFLLHLPPTIEAPYAAETAAALQESLRLPVVSSLAATAGHWLWIGNRAILYGKLAEACLAYEQAGPVGFLPLLLTYLHAHQGTSALQLVAACRDVLETHQVLTPQLSPQPSLALLHNIPEDGEGSSSEPAALPMPLSPSDGPSRSASASTIASNSSRDSSSTSRRRRSPAVSHHSSLAPALPPALAPFVEAVILAYAQHYLACKVHVRLDVDLWSGNTSHAQANPQAFAESVVAVPLPHAVYGSDNDGGGLPALGRNAYQLYPRARCLNALEADPLGNAAFCLHSLLAIGAWRAAGILVAAIGLRQGLSEAAPLIEEARSFLGSEAAEEAAWEEVGAGVADACFQYLAACDAATVAQSLVGALPVLKALRKARLLNKALEAQLWGRVLHACVLRAWEWVDEAPVLSTDAACHAGGAIHAAFLRKLLHQRSPSTSPDPPPEALRRYSFARKRLRAAAKAHGLEGFLHSTHDAPRPHSPRRTAATATAAAGDSNKEALPDLLLVGWLSLQWAIQLSGLDSKALFSQALSLSSPGMAASRSSSSMAERAPQLLASARTLFLLTWLDHARCSGAFWVHQAGATANLSTSGLWVWQQAPAPGAHYRSTKDVAAAWAQESCWAAAQLMTAARTIRSRPGRRRVHGQNELLAAAAAAASVVARSGLVEPLAVAPCLAWGMRAEASINEGMPHSHIARRLRMALAGPTTPLPPVIGIGLLDRSVERLMAAAVHENVRSHISVGGDTSWRSEGHGQRPALTPSADTPRRKSPWVQIASSLETLYQDCHASLLAALAAEGTAARRSSTPSSLKSHSTASVSWRPEDAGIIGASASVWADVASNARFLEFCVTSIHEFFPQSSAPLLASPVGAVPRIRQSGAVEEVAPAPEPRRITAAKSLSPTNSWRTSPPHNTANGVSTSPRRSSPKKSPLSSARKPRVDTTSPRAANWPMASRLAMHNESKTDTTSLPSPPNGHSRPRNRPPLGAAGSSKPFGLKGGGKPPAGLSPPEPAPGYNPLATAWRDMDRAYQGGLRRSLAMEPLLPRRQYQHETKASPDPPEDDRPHRTAFKSTAAVEAVRQSVDSAELEAKQSAYMLLLQRQHDSRARAARLRLLHARQSVEDSIAIMERRKMLVQGRRETQLSEPAPPAVSDGSTTQTRVDQEPAATVAHSTSLRQSTAVEEEKVAFVGVQDQGSDVEYESRDFGDELLQSFGLPRRGRARKGAADTLPPPSAASPTQAAAAPLTYLPPLVLEWEAAGEGKDDDGGVSDASVHLPKGLKGIDTREFAPRTAYQFPRATTRDGALQRLNPTGRGIKGAEGQQQRGPPPSTHKRTKKATTAPAPPRRLESGGGVYQVLNIPSPLGQSEAQQEAAPPSFNPQAMADAIADAVSATFTSYLRSQPPPGAPARTTAPPVRRPPAPSSTAATQAGPHAGVGVPKEDRATSPRPLPIEEKAVGSEEAQTLAEHQGTQTSPFIPSPVPKPKLPVASPVFLGVTDITDMSDDEEGSDDDSGSELHIRKPLSRPSVMRYSPVDTGAAGEEQRSPQHPDRPRSPFRQPAFMEEGEKEEASAPASVPGRVSADEGSEGVTNEDRGRTADNAEHKAAPGVVAAPSTSDVGVQTDGPSDGSNAAAAPGHDVPETDIQQRPSEESEGAEAADTQHPQPSASGPEPPTPGVHIPPLTSDFEARLGILTRQLQVS